MANHTKPHLGIFGRRNNGKSSIINAISGQNTAIVSEFAGTTTDPVKKIMEIIGIGPVVLIDTAGIDDVGELGKQRVDKSKKVVRICDIAVLVITNNQFDIFEEELIKEFNEFSIPYFVIHNKSDKYKLNDEIKNKYEKCSNTKVLEFSALNYTNIDNIIELIVKYIPKSAFYKPKAIGDIINKDDLIVLVMPQDDEAPEGRLILPQNQVVREVLDANAVAICLQTDQLEQYLTTTKDKPNLVVTDSQVFGIVSKIVPKEIPLTSFSILFARMKGDFDAYLKGIDKFNELQNGDRLLILESCTHNISCGDIGREKLPNWIRKYTGKKLEFDVVSGLDYPSRDIGEYKLAIQCGGCVVTRKQLLNRLKIALDANVAVTNYGLTIAYINGILNRVIEPFKKSNEFSLKEI